MLLLTPCSRSGLIPPFSYQLTYYLSRHKPNYRPCPGGTVGFGGGGGVRRRVELIPSVCLFSSETPPLNSPAQAPSGTFPPYQQAFRNTFTAPLRSLATSHSYPSLASLLAPLTEDLTAGINPTLVVAPESSSPDMVKGAQVSGYGLPLDKNPKPGGWQRFCPTASVSPIVKWKGKGAYVVPTVPV